MNRFARFVARRWCHSSVASNKAVVEPKGIVEKLLSRNIIRLSGEETLPFLQGLVTNDVNHLNTNPSIYAMFLNKPGRVLYDVIIYRPKTDGNEFFIECDQDVAQELRKHMMMYRIRKKISIDIVGDEYSLWTVCCPPENLELNDFPIESPDPRLKSHNHRIVTTASDSEMQKRFHLAEVNDNNVQYKLLRYKAGIGEGVQEIIPGKAMPLEFNCDYLHGLSVHKGCYLGQEFTARTYHTGVIRKRIMPIAFDEDATQEIVNADVTTKDGHAAGKIKAIEQQNGLGLLRIEHVLEAGKELQVKRSEHKVITWRPEWWPVEAPKVATKD